MPQLDTPIAGVIGGFRLPRLHPDVTLRELCRVLAAPGVNGAIVEAPGIPVTVVTAVDVVRAVARGASLDDTTAGGIAPAHPAQVHAGTPAISAVTTMAAAGATCALVLDEDGLVGAASLLDLVAQLLVDPSPRRASREAES